MNQATTVSRLEKGNLKATISRVYVCDGPENAPTRFFQLEIYDGAKLYEKSLYKSDLKARQYVKDLFSSLRR